MTEIEIQFLTGDRTVSMHLVTSGQAVLYSVHMYLFIERSFRKFLFKVNGFPLVAYFGGR